MKRILILGAAGAGKSTLAMKIGQILKIPVVHLDSYYWNPNWEGTPRNQWEDKIKPLIVEDRWVMDGNYVSHLSTFGLRVKRADAIIFLDFPRRQSYLRIFLRFLRYRGKTRPDLGEGCPERIDWEFLKYIWTYPKRKSRVLRYLKDLSDTKDVFILYNQKQMDRFVELLKIRTDWVDRKSSLYLEFKIWS